MYPACGKLSTERPTLYAVVSGYLEPAHCAIADQVAPKHGYRFDQIFSVDHFPDPLDDQKWIYYDGQIAYYEKQRQIDGPFPDSQNV